jgi:hypothetical protein
MGDNAKVLTIRLRVQDDGSVVLERGAKSLDRFATSEERAGASARKASKDIEVETQSVKGFLDTIEQAKNAAEVALGALAVERAAHFLKEILQVGVEFNAEMQTSRLGIAAIATGFGDIRDSNGRLLQGTEKWNAALEISHDLQNRALAASLEMKTTYEDLVDVIKVGLAPELEAGAKSTADIVRLSGLLAQAGGVLGFSGNRLTQEVRSILTGNAKQSELGNVLLGDVSTEKLEQLKQSGELVKFLTQRLEAFAIAGKASMQTVDTASANLKQTLRQALGEGTIELTETLVRVMNEVGESFYTVDEHGHRAFDQNLIEAIKTVARGAADVVEFVGTLVKQLKEVASIYHELNHPTISTEDLKAKLQSDLQYLAFAQKELQMAGKALLPTERKQYEEAIARWQAMVSEDRRLLARRALPPGEEYGPSKDDAPKPDFDNKPKLKDPTAEQLKQFAKIKDDYNLAVEQLRRESEHAGDPLASALDKIYDERDKKIADLKRQQEALKMVLGAKQVFDRAIAGYGDLAEQEAQNTSFTIASQQRSTIPLIAQHALGLDPASRFAKETALKTQREIEDGRLAIMKDAAVRHADIIDLELSAQLTANQRELDDAAEKYGQNSAQYAAVTAAKEAKDAEAFDKANFLRDQDTAGTQAWADKVRGIILGQVGDLPALMTQATVNTHLAVTGEIESFLNDVVDGQANALKSIEDLAHSLGSVWAHQLAGMLTNGESFVDQLKAKWQSMKDEKGIDAALDGAGMGAMIGGVFQTSRNQASLGGTVGGAIGSIWGPIGSLIGSAIGTAVGSLIQKGEDHIRVAITNATAASLGSVGSRTIGGNNDHQYTRVDLGGGGSIFVDEKGISEAARQDLTTQIKRKVKETMKSYQDIIDMLPQDLQDQLAAMKLPPAMLNLTGGVEQGDIRDESALQSLQDFLGDKMPKAAFAAYRGSITAALQLLGVQSGQIDKLFQQFGELQGQELHDAVQGYFRAIIDEADLEKKLGGGKEVREQYARDQLARTPISGLHDLNSQMALGVASMGKLTDIQDLTAAQQRLNDLARQYFDQSESAMEGLIQLQKSLHESNASLREQIQLAGMGDQQKMDYYYQQLSDLRAQLEHSTDPNEIASIEAKMRNYVQAALGIDPNDKENRDKLLKIIDDIEKMGDGRIEGLKNDIANEDLKAAKALQDAAVLLKGAADALHPPAPNPTPPDDGGGGGGGGDDNGGHVPIAPGKLADDMDQMLAAMRDLPESIAEAIDRQLRDLRIPIELDVAGTDELIEVVVARSSTRIVRALQRNRDLLDSVVTGS